MIQSKYGETPVRDTGVRLHQQANGQGVAVAIATSGCSESLTIAKPDLGLFEVRFDSPSNGLLWKA